MPNAKDITNPPQSLLAVGDIGGGKTAGFLTLPGPKFIYVFEPNSLTTLAGHDLEYEEFIPKDISLDAITLRKDQGTVVRDRISKHKEPMTYINWEEDFEKKLHDGFFDQFDWLGLDSITMFQAIIIDRITYLNKRYGKKPEIDDYVATSNTAVNVFRELTGLGKPLYVTGHTTFDKDEVTGKLQNILMFIGQMRKRIPLLFSEVWVAYGGIGPKGERQFFVKTQQDKDNPYIRCSSRFINPVEDVTVDWSQSLEGQGVGGLLSRTSIAKGG